MDAFKEVIERTHNLIHKYGMTICFDGWDNIAEHPLLNVMFACPNGNVLFGLVIGRLGKSNMGEMNCEKGENYFFFIQ